MVDWSKELLVELFRVILERDGFGGLMVSMLASGTRVRGLDFSGI